MPNRIKTHLKKLDTFRDEVDEGTDKMMGLIANNIDVFLKKPKEFLKAISIEFLKEKKSLFSGARKEGKLLQKSL